MEIKEKDYHIIYEPETGTIRCEGLFQAMSAEGYAPAVQLFNSAADRHPDTLVLDLRDLEFVNSSGLKIIAGFAVSMRKKSVQLIIRGTARHLWQRKSLKNLKQLMPDLKLEFD